MLKKIQDHIDSHHLFKPEDKILLAVSGGIDSMVMIHVFQALGMPVGVAHCNFQLRGSEADQDEKFVQEFCSRHQLPFFCQRFDTNNYAIQHGLSIQMAARELRYHWFEQLINEHHFHYIATAHHLDDSLETSLLNLARGTGAKGISGIAAKNGNRIRPLLSLTREEIANYAADYQITWREDSSNRSLDYSRNVVRQKIVPYLKDINPALVNAFSQFVERMEGAQELIGLALVQWKDKYWLEESGRITIQKKGLEVFGHKASVLYELIKKFGFNLTQCEEITHALGSQPGKRFFSHPYELVIDRDCLIIVSLPSEAIKKRIDNISQSVQTATATLSFRLEKSNTVSTAPHQASLDYDRLKWPLVWRKWKEGDVFYPLGMKHRKKVSDFLIDLKVSLPDKEQVTVLQSGEDIVWVVGHRIDDRYKITAKTVQVLVAEIRAK